jgi:hypothetical protein
LDSDSTAHLLVSRHGIVHEYIACSILCILRIVHEYIACSILRIVYEYIGYEYIVHIAHSAQYTVPGASCMSIQHVAYCA